jgi:hypothetical protein
MTSQPRTQAELVENSRKVLYKIWMFAQTSRLTSGVSASATQGFDEQVVNAALIESMLINTRELMHFLYAASSRNYIRAVDYLPDPSVIPPKWPEYNTDLAQINNDTAHLTYDDLPNPITIAAPGHLAGALMAFVQAVPADRVQASFKVIAWGVLADRFSGGAELTVAPRDGSHVPVRGHRIHELFDT